MGTLDLTLLVVITLGTLTLGLVVGRRQAQKPDGFLMGGRDLPWWLAGTSMVATTFAVDTPLVVAGVTATKGLAGNWFWWGLLFSHLIVTFFLAARWQSTGCTTDAEVVTHRYGHGSAARRGARVHVLLGRALRKRQRVGTGARRARPRGAVRPLRVGHVGGTRAAAR